MTLNFSNILEVLRIFCIHLLLDWCMPSIGRRDVKMDRFPTPVAFSNLLGEEVHCVYRTEAFESVIQNESFDENQI